MSALNQTFRIILFKMFKPSHTYILVLDPHQQMYQMCTDVCSKF